MQNAHPSPCPATALSVRLLAILAMTAPAWAAAPAHAQPSVTLYSPVDPATLPGPAGHERAALPQGDGHPEKQASWSGELWFGLRRVPDYEGSRTSHVSALPGLSLRYATKDNGSFVMGPTGLGWNFLERPDASLSVGFQASPGRSDRGHTGLHPGSERLAGMGKVAASPVLVLEGTRTLGGVPLALSLKRATSSERGTRLGLSLPLGGRTDAGLSWRLAPGIELADRRYEQAFFGVDAAQSSATGRPRHEPRAGLKSAALEGGLDYALDRHWSLGISLQGERLLGDAARSPVVERKNQFGGDMHVGYRF